jgi:hypothetical protein
MNYVPMDKLVLKVAVAFKEELAKHGKKFQFSQCSDLTQTYHYRTFNRFVKKCYDELDSKNDEEILEVVRIIVNNNSNNLSRITPDILCVSNLREICMSELMSGEEKKKSILNSIKNSIDNVSCDLALKAKHGVTNLTRLKNSKSISNEYIACSRKALSILIRLDYSEKSMFLPYHKYFMLRRKILKLVGVEALREILKDDLCST